MLVSRRWRRPVKKYPLTVSGTYVLDGTSHPFTAQTGARGRTLRRDRLWPPTVGTIPEKGERPRARLRRPRRSRRRTTTTRRGRHSRWPAAGSRSPLRPPEPAWRLRRWGSSVTFVRDTGTGQAGNYPPDPTVGATAGRQASYSPAATPPRFALDGRRSKLSRASIPPPSGSRTLTAGCAVTR